MSTPVDDMMNIARLAETRIWNSLIRDWIKFIATTAAYRECFSVRRIVV